MSYTLTLDMPPKAVRFVERQTARHGTDLSALFVDFLREHFGFGENEEVEDVQGPPEDVGMLTRQLSGIVSIPDDVFDNELVATAMLERYNSLT